jgi:hypothetical protein
MANWVVHRLVCAIRLMERIRELEGCTVPINQLLDISSSLLIIDRTNKLTGVEG